MNIYSEKPTIIGSFSEQIFIYSYIHLLYYYDNDWSSIFCHHDFELNFLMGFTKMRKMDKP